MKNIEAIVDKKVRILKEQYSKIPTMPYLVSYQEDEGCIIAWNIARFSSKEDAHCFTKKCLPVKATKHPSVFDIVQENFFEKYKTEVAK